MPGACDNCHERPPAYNERVDYVSFNGKERIRQKDLRRVCGTCANIIIDALPRGGSMPAVVQALVDYAHDQTAENWTAVERSVAPFVAMGKQEPLFV